MAEKEKKQQGGTPFGSTNVFTKQMGDEVKNRCSTERITREQLENPMFLKDLGTDKMFAPAYNHYMKQHPDGNTSFKKHVLKHVGDYEKEALIKLQLEDEESFHDAWSKTAVVEFLEAKDGHQKNEAELKAFTEYEQKEEARGKDYDEFSRKMFGCMEEDQKQDQVLSNRLEQRKNMMKKIDEEKLKQLEEQRFASKQVLEARLKLIRNLKSLKSDKPSWRP